MTYSFYKTAKRLTLGATALAISCGAAFAEYPEKPITLVAPYGAGGASDLASRTLSAVAHTYLDQPMLVVNRTGAGGAVGSTYVNRAKPDGYTLLLARIGSQAVSPAMKASMPYKYGDFTMLGLLELNPIICATSKDKPYNSLADFVAAVKAKPGELSYSSSGVGTLLHIAVPFMLDTVGVANAKEAVRHVPYKGGGAATTAMIGGQVDILCTNAPALASHIQAGTVKALVVTTPKRVSMAPDTPTAAELGYPLMEQLIGWSALYGPPGMDDAVKAKLEGMLAKVAKDKAWNKFTKALGSVPQIRNSADTRAFVDGQVKAFSTLVDKLGMKIQ